MIGGKTRKIAGVAVVALAVAGGGYLAGAKALGACDGKAKATKAALTSNGATTCEKVHASAMASKSGTDAKAQNAVLTSTNAKADDCCDSKATTAAATVSKNGSCDSKTTTAAATVSKNGSCDSKTTTAAATEAEGTCGAKATTAALVSKNGSCDSKTTTAAATEADACPVKSQATKTAASEKADCPEGSCPMEKGAKGTRKDATKKAGPKTAVASVVPAESTAK